MKRVFRGSHSVRSALLMVLTVISCWTASSTVTSGVAGAVIPVTSTAESPGAPGDCTLGEAIQAANTNAAVDLCPAGSGAGADTIVLAAATYTLTSLGFSDPFFGDSGLPAVVSDIVIQGAGSDDTIIERDVNAPEFRLFTLANQGAGSLGLSDLTVRHGRWSGIAGALYTAGRPITLTRVVFDDNRSGHSGGAISANTGAGVVVADECIFTNNHSSVSGGAIGRLSVHASHSTFSGNSAPSGGALASGADFQITDSIFTDNSATQAFGGAIFNSGTTVIVRSTFSGNSAANGEGGAMSVAGTISITDSTITNNQAREVGGIAAGSFRTTLGVPYLTINRSSISNNQSARSAGGILAFGGTTAISNSTIAQNTASLNGGGINSVDSVLILRNVTIDGNSAGGPGGGIYRQDRNDATSLDLNNVTLTNNHSDSSGGGLYRDSSPISFGNSIIALNTSGIAAGHDIDASALTSRGYNLVGIRDGAGFIDAEGDQSGTIAAPLDPMLGPLQSDGAATPTRALLAGSPALDAGNPAAPGSGGNACEAADQRGVGRPRDGDGDGTAACDVGAHETIGAVTCVPPPDGMTAWWAFDGNADDMLETTPATLVGGPAFVAGEVAGALAFDGADDHVVIQASAPLDIGVSQGMTFDAWIKPSDVGVAQPLIEWNSGAGTEGVHLWMSADFSEGGQGQGSLFVNLVDASTHYHIFSTVPGLLVGNVWQHVAVTYDQVSGVGKIYLNGNVVAQQNLGSFVPQTGTDLYLGYRPAGVLAGRRFVGGLDEVKLFSRALDDAEIRAIYFADAAGTCKPCKCVIDPGGTFVPASGGSGTVTVTLGPGFNCPWTATTADSFITVAPQSGEGSGTVSYKVAANTGDARTGTININSQVFTVSQYGGVPGINSFSPASAERGTLVTISGYGFVDVTSVKFNGVEATFTVNSPSQIAAIVPSSATTGPVAVANANGTGVSSVDFVVIGTPVITSFSPAQGGAGSLVTILGSGFAGTTAVQFGGVNGSFFVNSDTTITAVVPQNPLTGKISVTNAAGTAISATDFIAPPRVDSLNPATGVVGTSVRISGANFVGATAVAFNGVAANFTVNSSVQITAVVPAAATTGRVTVTNAGVTATSASNFVVIATPVITSFSPMTGAAGTQVVLIGSGFTGTTSVKFDALDGTFVVNSATKITAKAPRNVRSGKISVTNPAGTGISAADFTVAPRLDSYSPGSGSFGTRVTIAGENFNGTTSVKFDGAGANYTIQNRNTIYATVPLATTGRITVTNAAGTATSTRDFTIYPKISGFTPTSGEVGTRVTINGSGFPNITSVKFGNTSARFFQLGSTQIVATVPAGASSGRISVSAGFVSTSSAASFEVVDPPVTISGFTPASGAPGTYVSISGGQFCNITSVTFNGVPATSFTRGCSTSFRALVPLEATAGYISVTNSRGTAVSPTPFMVAPKITRIAPSTAPIGASVIITGAGFENITSVAFNGTPAAFTVDSLTQITAIVPLNTTKGPITVANAYGTATSTQLFTVWKLGL